MRAAPAGHPARGPRPVLPVGTRIDDYTPRDIERVVIWVVSDGVVRGREELEREVMRELGFHKLGRRIHTSIVSAIRRAHSRRTA